MSVTPPSSGSLQTSPGKGSVKKISFTERYESLPKVEQQNSINNSIETIKELGASSSSAACLREIQSRIRSLLEYPASLRRRGIQGQVILKFEITHQGYIEKIEISKSSGYLELDRLAKESVQKAEPFPCLDFRKEEMGRFSLNLPIDFTITD